MLVLMGNLDCFSVSISANQIHEFGSFQSLWDLKFDFQSEIGFNQVLLQVLDSFCFSDLLCIGLIGIAIQVLFCSFLVADLDSHHLKLWCLDI